MYKRILLVLALGVSFSPALFAHGFETERSTGQKSAAASRVLFGGAKCGREDGFVKADHENESEKPKKGLFHFSGHQAR